MQPKLAEKLMKSKEIKDFVAFLLEEVDKLNTISDIDIEINTDPINLAVEIKARKFASERLIKILEPLLNSREKQTFNKKEYIT